MVAAILWGNLLEFPKTTKIFAGLPKNLSPLHKTQAIEVGTENFGATCGILDVFQTLLKKLLMLLQCQPDRKGLTFLKKTMVIDHIRLG